jgi:hypothetical protein
MPVSPPFRGIVLHPSPAFAGAGLLGAYLYVRFIPQDLHALYLVIFDQPILQDFFIIRLAG